MTSTMKKAPKKFVMKAKKSAEPTELVPMPADWVGTVPHVTLAGRLRKYVSEERLFETMAVDEEVAHGDIIPTLERWLTDRLKDDERAQLATFAALMEWMDSDDAHSASAAQFVVPDCFLPVAEAFCQSAEALRTEFNGRIVDEPTDAPSTNDQATEVEAPEAVADAIGADDLATVKEPNAAGQLPLVDEAKQPAKKITALSLDSSDEVSSVRLALQARAEDLEAEAKRLTGLGKQAESTSVLREAKNIKDKLMKQVSVQTAVEFNANESLPSAIARVVSGEIRSRARAALLKSAATKKGESRQDAEERQRMKLDDLEALIGNIGEQAGALVATILVETAEGAKEAGLRERNATSSQLAREAIQRIEAQRIQ